jgi:Acetyltransferase (GNAT) domain
MIRFLKRNEIDIARWDRCISEAENGQIFVYSYYMDVCCKHWGALVKGDYESVFPLAWDQKFGISYLYQPHYTRHFGVYGKSNNKESFAEFMAKQPKQFNYIDYSIIQNDIAAIAGIRTEEKVHQQLSLGKTIDEIRSKYSDNLKRNLKKAAAESYTTTTDFSHGIIIEEFRKLKNEKDLDYSEKNLSTLSKLMQVLSDKGVTHKMGVLKGDELIAGAFFMETNNRIIYLKGFSKEEGKKNGAMHLLFDQFIQEHAGENKIFDFGGSNVAGVARFYKNFGATDSVYLHLHQNKLPKLIRWIKK